MSYSAADKRRVFLAYRPVFVGPNAQLRRHGKVREVIERHKNSFGPLLNDFGFEKIIEIVKILLVGQVFESELKAKIAFPELFQTSPSRDVQRAESENDVARSEAEALQEMMSAGDLIEAEEESGQDDETDASKMLPARALSLYPPYLPYHAQHLILVAAQRQLEDCCFEFASRWLPTLIKERKWDCAEAVELTTWTRILPRRCEKVPACAIEKSSGISLDEIFFNTNILRHTAVHRLPRTAKGIQEIINSALVLAKTLKDHPRAARLEHLYLELESRIRDMEINKNFLENRLDEQLQSIAEQRAELDRQEEEAVAMMLKDDLENKFLIGSFLEAICKEDFEVEDSKQAKSEVMDQARLPIDEANGDTTS